MHYNRILPLLFFSLIAHFLLAQGKRQLEHADVHLWKKIEQQRISNDGKWTAWVQVSVTEGDPSLFVWDAVTQQKRVFPRGTEARFSEDSKLLVFRIKVPLDTLKSMRRKKVKDDDLPKDSLGILRLETGQLEKIPRLKSFVLPEKWSGLLAFQCEVAKPEPVKKDSTKTIVADKPKGKKAKKEDKDNGYRLILRNTQRGTQDTIAYVSQFILAKRGKRLLLQSTGKGDTMLFRANPLVGQAGIYILDMERDEVKPIFRKKGKYQQLAFDDFGTQAAFLADIDTSKARIRPWQLMYWKEASKDSAESIADNQSPFLAGMSSASKLAENKDMILSENYKPTFSDDASKLYFGAVLPPILNDTTLLSEEIVQVEVWAWTEKRLYTEQKVRMEMDKKRSFPIVFFPEKKKFIPLGSPEIPEIRMQKERNVNVALGITEEPYAAYLTSEGTAHKDLFVIDLERGEKRQIIKDLRCNPQISPAGRYIFWWSDPDTAWFVYNIKRDTRVKVSDNKIAAFFNVETDIPDFPNEYGAAGWMEDDAAFLIYDQYDIWKMDPDGQQKPERLTSGRDKQTTYRYIRLDPERTSISPKENMLLHCFNEVDKSEAYAWLNNKITSPWLQSQMAYSKQPLKAQKSNALIFTRESHQSFPDLEYVASVKDSPIKISNANPQQGNYHWGSIEMVDWTSLSGEKIKGLLVKPDDYDPKKQYPLIVNFYEKLSDELNLHRSPNFHRSQINFTFYASRGYLVFAPDIPYQTGYPGQSAYDAIVSGVTALINKGGVDPKRIALQGHSWGGYQSAYLITKTNMFRCAEAGAPVANMTSAYGGIRWETGLSRAFQYEHQQSRIGGTLWEYPMRYLENSPLFSLDRVNTPVLILHNDKDGAVPWYQGIELYSGLRRLGKPAWLLNYNDEPHWPVKLQNRIDFQTRMQQFFDYYLMGKPLPRWMERGVPPIEKGILQGLEDARG